MGGRKTRNRELVGVAGEGRADRRAAWQTPRHLGAHATAHPYTASPCRALRSPSLPTLLVSTSALPPCRLARAYCLTRHQTISPSEPRERTATSDG